MEKPQISIFAGHFGSGKTEFSINFALKAARNGKNTTLVDIDIINPFYRSSEVKEVLTRNNINLISPNFVGTTSDVPSLPPAIQGVFNKKDGAIIFDVGGDPDGAKVLGRYNTFFKNTLYNMYSVINTRRPFTSTVEDIISYIQEIELNSRLKITHLISNTNLAYETTKEVIEEGINVVKKASEITKLPLAFIGVPDSLKSSLADQYKELIFPLDLYMTRWHNS